MTLAPRVRRCRPHGSRGAGSWERGRAARLRMTVGGTGAAPPSAAASLTRLARSGAPTGSRQLLSYPARYSEPPALTKCSVPPNNTNITVLNTMVLLCVGEIVHRACSACSAARGGSIITVHQRTYVVACVYFKDLASDGVEVVRSPEFKQEMGPKWLETRKIGHTFDDGFGLAAPVLAPLEQPSQTW